MEFTVNGLVKYFMSYEDPLRFVLPSGYIKS